MDNADEWVDYVVEAKLSFTEATGTNGGVMFRVDPDTIGTGSNALDGYYVGIKNTGVEVGYFNQAWKKITTVSKTLTAGQVYDLKIVVYDNMFAAYLDGELVYLYTDTADMFTSGTVGVRSYNQAFTTSALSVRGVTASDLMVFGGDPSFFDDFEDGNDGTWTLYGNTGSMTFKDGKLNFAEDANVKAVAGDSSWSDYVVDVDIDLTSNTANDWRNAGIAFRVSNAKSGTDAFNGYYFGIGATTYTTGKWTQAYSRFALNVPYNFGNGKHKLTAVAEGSILMFYVDGKLIDVYNDSTYTSGQIALRSYNRAFTADNVTVRSMNDTEKADLAAHLAKGTGITVSAVTAEKVIQLKYPKVGDGLTCRIVYGKESGVYTETYTDLPCYNGVNKVAFSVPENGTYYVKLYMMKGDTIVAQSNEIVATTGFIDDTANEKAGLTAELAAARALDTTDFTKDSLARLQAAIAEADALVTKSGANQMDYRLAKDMLTVSMKTTDTVYPEAHVWDQEYTVDTPATCTTAGSKSIHCSHCELTKDVTTIPATGNHSYTVEVEGSRTAATCMATGSVTMKCATCTATQVQTLEIDPDNHTGKNTTVNAKDASCAAEGYTGDTVCECGQTVATGETIPATGNHSYDKGVVTVQPTTTKEGVKTYTCGVCGATKTEKIAKTKPTINFIDVKKSDYFYNAVAWAVEEGITTGTSKTEFSPEESCTRAQAVTFLWRAAGSPAPKSSNNPFKDVKKSDYYYKAVLWAVENGITKGTGATAFSPDEACTRGQIVTFLWRAQSGKKVSATNPFTDVKSSDYYYNAVLWAVKNDVTTGTSPKAFSPADTCTRGQIVTFLYRAMAK